LITSYNVQLNFRRRLATANTAVQVYIGLRNKAISAATARHNWIW